MAQIKNIKKPGDLIRGATVGLAGLDKDGNVVGYKAAAADAGKVLTVGVDGSVTPAAGGGGGGTLYNHLIHTTLTGTTVSRIVISIINSSDEFILGSASAPLDILCEWLSSRGCTSGATMYPATGGTATNGYITCGVYGENNKVYVVCVNPASTANLAYEHPATYANEMVIPV